jgi:hypothetical protein
MPVGCWWAPRMERRGRKRLTWKHKLYWMYKPRLFSLLLCIFENAKLRSVYLAGQSVTILSIILTISGSIWLVRVWIQTLLIDWMFLHLVLILSIYVCMWLHLMGWWCRIGMTFGEFDMCLITSVWPMCLITLVVSSWWYVLFLLDLYAGTFHWDEVICVVLFN